MKKLNTVALAVAVSLGVAASAFAHPGQMGGRMGPGAQSGQHQGMQGGMGHAAMQGMNHGQGRAARGENCDGARSQTPRGPQTGQSLMTPEERAAFRDKMRNAKTPDERQQIAMANRVEMEKRAAEKGITLPEHRGPHGRANAPAATE